MPQCVVTKADDQWAMPRMVSSALSNAATPDVVAGPDAQPEVQIELPFPAPPPLPQRRSVRRLPTLQTPRSGDRSGRRRRR